VDARLKLEVVERGSCFFCCSVNTLARNMAGTSRIEDVNVDLPPDSETKYETYMGMNMGQLKGMLRDAKLMVEGEKQQLVVRLIRRMAGMPPTAADAALSAAAAAAANAAKAKKQEAAKAKAAEVKAAKESAAVAASKASAAAAAAEHVDAISGAQPEEKASPVRPSSPPLGPSSSPLGPSSPQGKRKASTPGGRELEEPEWPKRFVVCNEKKVGLLPKPDSEAQVTGYLRPQEVFSASQETLDPSGKRFLLLADFRGWIPECSRKDPNKKIVQEVVSDAKKARMTAQASEEKARVAAQASEENLRAFVEKYIDGIDIEKVTLTDLNKALEAKFGEVPIEKWKLVRGLATEVIQKKSEMAEREAANSSTQDAVQ